MKEGRPAVVAYGQLEEVNEMLRLRAKEKNCELHWALPPEDVRGYAADYSLKGIHFSPPYNLSINHNSLKGDHQLFNLGVIMTTVDILREEGWKLDYDHVIQGLRSVSWPGRLQTISWKGREVNLSLSLPLSHAHIHIPDLTYLTY